MPPGVHKMRSTKPRYLYLLRYGVNTRGRQAPWPGNGFAPHAAYVLMKTAKVFAIIFTSAQSSAQLNKPLAKQASRSLWAVIRSGTPLLLSYCAVAVIFALYRRY